MKHKALRGKIHYDNGFMRGYLMNMESDHDFLERQKEFLKFIRLNGNFPANLKAPDFERLVLLAEKALENISI